MTSFLRRYRFLILGLALLAPCLWFASAHGAHAQGLSTGNVTTNELLSSEVGNVIGTGTTDLRITIARIIRVALGLLGTIALLLILYAGFLWMTAAGEEEKITRAKKTMTSAIIGLVIILSAFSITSFIISRLVDATAGGNTTSDGGGGGGGGGFGGETNVFKPLGIQPQGPLKKYDVIAAVTFNVAPTSETQNIKDNLLLEEVNGNARTSVDYEPVVENNTISLKPTQACPPPDDAKRCLKADKDYVITVKAGLKNASTSDPRTISCGGIASHCSQAFKTGSAVATGLPTVVLSGLASVAANDLVALESTATDDNGIAKIDYSADGAFFTSDGSVQQIADATYLSHAAWNTTGIAPVRTVALTAKVTNIDGDSVTSAPLNVTVRPPFCFNHVKDGDEVAVDCGGSCGACTGGTCTTDSQCSTGQCQNGQCVENPQITDIQPRENVNAAPNGKPGNLVTITGRHFGAAAGKVTFLGTNAAGDDKDAELASCSGAWSDGRIVIVVPTGAVNGPIQVAVAGGLKKDATNDGFGPKVLNFEINDIARPGICAVAPASVKTGQSMTVTGLAFGADRATSNVQLARTSADCSLAPDWSAAATASQISSWTDTSVQPTMPNIDTGVDGANYLLRLVVGGQASNTACVRAEPPSAGSEPRIDFLTPTSGSVGTYMTAFGANFGGGGTVHFKNTAGDAVGEITFPAQCASGYWTDSSVTIKVPGHFNDANHSAIPLGDYTVTVLRSDGRPSNGKPFTVNLDPVPPGVCRVDPNNGPVGTSVSFYGEGFGDIPTTNLKPDAITYQVSKNAISIGQWQSSSITSVKVPAGATTGAVVVKRYEGAVGTASNGINFQVSDCRQTGGDAVCGSGRLCCDDGACRASCGVQAAAGGFAWQFATGPVPIFPVVVENATCQISPPTIMPSPNPYKGVQDVCTDIGAIAVRFSLPMDVSTLNAGNLILEACGTGAGISATCSQVAGVQTPQTQDYDTDHRSITSLSFGGSLQASTWYRLTISDKLLSLGTPSRAAQPLDGDFDGKAGGKYVTTFKTGTTACTIAGAHVEPAKGLIDDADAKAAYTVFPLSERCIILACQTLDANKQVVGRAVSWSSSNPAKATVAPASATGQCTALATPISETEPGPSIQIKAIIDGKSDQGDLTIDYANPRVIQYGPRDCTEACLNTVAFAYFNTSMLETSVENPDNVKIFKCRNESCLAFDGQVQPLTPVYLDIHSPTQPNAGKKLLTFGNPSLVPNTFYRVVISGAVTSTSKAPLTGLNYHNDSFSWIFRTRPDANPCGPQKVSVDPAQTTLHYIGEVAPITALPFSSPDKCAAEGEILNSASFNWSWSKTQAPPTPVAFRFLPDAPVAGTLLNTNPVLPAGCSSSCLKTGSKPPGTPACNNGKVEKGEACDTPNLNGCNGNCQRAGNTGSSGCGNTSVEPNLGEECDAGSDPATGNGTAVSGCSKACLWVGSSAGLSACGNGSVGVGEACDDGNTEDGDGCSSICLLEGSQQSVYVCGNGRPEVGEQCDYTFKCAVSGTECAATSDCSQGNPADVCVRSSAVNLLLPNGARIPFGGTDERNPTKAAFACSPSCLLRGNTTACSGAGCCGDGTIDATKGEGCDAGPDNGTPGSGCSSICTKTGSSPELRAYCGDTFITVSAGGGGEECEAARLDANIDATQVVEAKNRCDTRDAASSCVASVTAGVTSVDGQAINPVSGQGGVSVECACRDDNDCNAFASPGHELSCGAGACCYPRPAPPTILPKGGHECRNAQISVTFEELMEPGSLQGNLIVEECGTGHITRNLEGGTWLSRAVRAIGDFFRSFVGTRADAVDTCHPIQGTFTHVTGGTAARPVTISTFAPDAVFEPDWVYRVTVKGDTLGATVIPGVKTMKGVGYKGEGYPSGHHITQKFSTGAEICSFDSVQVEPAVDLLEKSSDVLPINATAMTNHDGQLQPIAPVTDVYDWTWSWAAVPENTPPGSLLTLTSAAAPSATVQANKGLNGREQVLAIAKIKNDKLFVPPTVDRQLVGKSVITVMLCERPWPARNVATGAWAPYVDPATHFEFYYCRDNAEAPLPELQDMPIQGQSAQSGNLLRFCRTTRDGEQPMACFTNADCNAGDTCLSKDLFFQFKPETKINDAIGVRVYDNADRLTPTEWFQAQHFSGSTQAVNVDGYAGIKDARTVYVGAVDKYGDPKLRPYVYVFAFNDKADPRTAEVFDRLVKGARFNTNLVPSDKPVNVCKDGVGDLVTLGAASVAPVACSSDLDCFRAFAVPPAGLHCDSDKDKIRRDFRRWQDIRDIEAALEEVHDSSGFYPKLESGSFVRGFTTSKWPSWSQMGAAGAISDPLNAFNRCEDFGSECSISGQSCATDGDCHGGTGDRCRPRFEAGTCYDEGAGVFGCPADSHVYQYRSIGGVDYRMAVDFEYTDYPWIGSDCSVRGSASSCDAAVGCSWLPSGPTTGECQTRVTITPVCTGLFTDTTNKCLANPAVSCTDSADCAAQDHCVPTTMPLVGPAASASCGNGLLEVHEDCEVGQERNQSIGCTHGGVDVERCDGACHWQVVQACPGASVCGNGSVEAFAGESCDDGTQNGQYGRCRKDSLGCKKRCVNIKSREKYVAGDVGVSTCVSNADCAGETVCTDRMNFCGDGVKNGPELCDDGAKNGQYGFCAWDCRGAGPRCGDSVANGDEQCDGERSESAGVCVASNFTLADTATLNGSAKACSKNEDCASGFKCAICAPTAGNLSQTRSKSCFPASAPVAQACKFDSWSACKQSGACGNGKQEGFEECDAGTGNSVTGACLPSCKKNVCNDSFVLTGTEQCDNGTADGVLCKPLYGLTCNYCKTDCSIETVSGAFCGDAGTGSPPKLTIDSPPESCDPGPVAAWCSRTYTDPLHPYTVTQPGNQLKGVKGCTSNNDCVPGVCRNYAGASTGDILEFQQHQDASASTGLLETGLGRIAMATVDLVRASAMAPLGYSGTVNQLASFHLAVAGDTVPPDTGALIVSPDSPATNDIINLSAPNGTDLLSGVIDVKIYLTTGGVKVLKQTCAFSPAQSPASCGSEIGQLVAGSYTMSVETTDGNNNLKTATKDFTVDVASNNPPPPEEDTDDATTPDDEPDDSEPGPVCGDSVCSQGESGLLCPHDCKACWSSSDCTATQFCSGGDGQCTAFNVQCQAEPYSNTKAPGTATYFDGSCNSCTSSCGNTLAKSPFFCGDDIVQKQFGEHCEGVGDANATKAKKTQYGCTVDCRFTGGYCGDNIVQSQSPINERCDQGGKCITTTQDDPALHLKVDMIFSVDISGSMQDYIDNISDAINSFVGTYQNTEHRFGLVAFGQSGPPPLEMRNGDHGRVVINLTTVSDFQNRFSALVADGGGVEPMYDSVYQLASASNNYAISWRNDAHPYIVVVTDEPPTCGYTITGSSSGCTGLSDSRWKNESQAAASVATCHIGSCASKPGYRVETFVISVATDKDGGNNKNRWDSVLYNEMTDRFIEIKPPSSANTPAKKVQYYVDKLKATTFKNVCAPSQNPSQTQQSGGTDFFVQ